MMSVEEYAIDVNKSIDGVIRKCREIGIDVTDKDYMLGEEEIIELDTVVDEIIDDEELDKLTDDVVSTKKIDIDIDNSVNTEKVKKKNVQNKNNIINDKKELASKKKDMYKNKEKLMSNAPVQNDNVVLYKENMTVSELADQLGVQGVELVKKLFMLGVMANVNNALSFYNAEILVFDY